MRQASLGRTGRIPPDLARELASLPPAVRAERLSAYLERHGKPARVTADGSTSYGPRRRSPE
jgi:hypothetical protein